MAAARSRRDEPAVPFAGTVPRHGHGRKARTSSTVLTRALRYIGILAFVGLATLAVAAPAATFEDFQAQMAAARGQMPVAAALVAGKTIEVDNLRAATVASALAVQSARAGLERAERGVRDFVTTDFDSAVALFRAATAELRRARAQLALAESQLALSRESLLRGEGELSAGQLEAARLEDKRLTLRAESEVFFAPRAIKRVVVTTRDFRSVIRPLFTVAWNLEEEDTASVRVEILQRLVAEAGRTMAALQVEYRHAEQQFIAADRRWQDLNERYANSALAQLLAGMAVEVADVGTGAVVNLETAGVYIIFEGVWRVGEVVLGGGFYRLGDDRLIQTPSLGDEFVAYRDALSKSEQSAYSVPGPAGSARSRFGWLLDGQDEEAVKGLVGTNIDAYVKLLAAERAQKEVLSQIQERGIAAVLQELMTTTEGPLNAALTSSAFTDGDRYKQLDAAILALTNGPPGDFSNAIALFANRKVIGEIARDFALSAGFTLLKSGLAEIEESRRVAIFQDMAHAEIDWFLRRNTLRAVATFMRAYAAAQAVLQVALGEALDAQTAGGCCGRTLERTDGKAMDEPVTIGMWQAKELEVLVEFNRPIRQGAGSFGDSDWAAFRAVDHLGELFTYKPVLPYPVSGRTALAIDASDPAGQPLDANPATPATLSANMEWQNYEPEVDRNIQLNVVVPALSVPADGVQTSSTFLVEVDNAPPGAALTIVPADAPEPIPGGNDLLRYPLHNQSSFHLSAPADVGTYAVRLIDTARMGHATLASASLGVVAPVHCDPQSGVGSHVASTFALGSEGWFTAGDAGDPTFANGEISASDREMSEVWYWVAPEKFLGDHSGAAGGALAYDLRVSDITRPFPSEDVTLSGGGLHLTINADGAPGVGLTPFRHALDTSAPWMRGDRRATESEICRVLSDVTALKIRGEYRTGPDTGWLSNVVLGH